MVSNLLTNKRNTFSNNKDNILYYIYRKNKNIKRIITISRWLRARKFHYLNVIKMVEEATECRSNASKFDFYPNPSDALGNNVEKSIYLAQYPQLYTGHSKEGYPVLYSKPGILNINGLESITNSDGLFNFHWWSMVSKLVLCRNFLFFLEIINDCPTCHCSLSDS